MRAPCGSPGLRHPLLGVAQSGAVAAWRADIDAHTHRFLGDHRLDGRPVFPAAGYLELMLAAARGDDGAAPIELRDMHFERVLWLDETQLVETAVDAQRRSVSVAGKSASGEARWQRQARARVHVPDGSVGPSTAIPSGAPDLDIAVLYARFERAGHGYGPLFRTLREASTPGKEFWGRIVLDVAIDVEGFLIHPALLDGALQLTLAAMPQDGERDAMYLPVHIDRVRFWRPARGEALCRVRNVHHQDGRSYADIDLFTNDGEAIAVLQACCCLKREQRFRLASSVASLYRETWVEAPFGQVLAARPASWVVVGAVDDNPLADAMRAAGVPIIRSACDDLPAGERRIVFWAAADLQRAPSTAGIADGAWPLVRIAQTLAAEARPARLIVVTVGATWGHLASVIDPTQAAIAGVLRTIAVELQHVECRLIDLDPSERQAQITRVLDELRRDALDDEVAYRAGKRFVQRVSAQPLHELKPLALTAQRRARCEFRLHSAAPGNLDRLEWIEMPTQPLAPGEVEIGVRATGLNFRDVLKALDVYPLQPTEDLWFGDECAGVVRRVAPDVMLFAAGDDVVAIAPRSFGNVVRVPACLVAHKPAALSFAHAATIPIAFLTADYALNEVARLQRGETVLIHAAAGGVGSRRRCRSRAESARR